MKENYDQKFNYHSQIIAETNQNDSGHSHKQYQTLFSHFLR
jgi:hypothetical protein